MQRSQKEVSRTVGSLSISMGTVCSRVGVLEDCELFFFRLRARSYAFGLGLLVSGVLSHAF